MKPNAFRNLRGYLSLAMTPRSTRKRGQINLQVTTGKRYCKCGRTSTLCTSVDDNKLTNTDLLFVSYLQIPNQPVFVQTEKHNNYWPF